MISSSGLYIGGGALLPVLHGQDIDCLLSFIFCVVLRGFNEFIKFFTEIDVRPSCFVHPCPIYLCTTKNNLNGLK